MHFNTTVKEIREHEVVLNIHGKEEVIKNDFVFAMTGYHPDHSFIRKMGVTIDEETGRPTYHPETMESNIENLFIAGVLAPATMPMKFSSKTVNSMEPLLQKQFKKKAKK